MLVLRLLIPAGVWGRSTVLDVWPWLEAARAGAELALDSAYSSPWTLSLPRGRIPLLPAEAPRSLTDWLFLLYLAGALGLALWYLGCALLLSLRVSRGVPVEGPRRAAIDAVAQRYQLARGGVPLGAQPLPDGISCSRPGPAYGLGAGRKGHPP